MERPTVFVIDDDPGVRDSLSVLLRSAGYEAETFASGASFLESQHDARPGCVIADFRMPGMTGIELHLRLLQRGSDIPVIIISAYGDIPVAVEAMSRGAVTFLEKPFGDEILLDWVKHAIRADAARRKHRVASERVRERASQLTHREREVLDHVLSGRSSRQIAHALSISPRTIEVHRANIMRKLEAGNLAELIRIAMTLKDESIANTIDDER